MPANFNTINGRFLGYTKAQWEAKKKEYGLTDDQLLDVLQTQAKTKAHGEAAKRFYRSGKLGTPNN